MKGGYIMARVYQDDSKEAAYENACDCLYYGYGKQYWNNCGLSETDSNIVWSEARNKLSSL